MHRILTWALPALLIFFGTPVFVSVKKAIHLKILEPPVHVSSGLSKCAALREKVAYTETFHDRTHSDRFAAGAKSVLIKRARIWTGDKNGTEIMRGDILLENGIIRRVGRSLDASLDVDASSLTVLDVDDAWVTPGLVDIQSHRGILPTPTLKTVLEDHPLDEFVQPWLRIIDGLSTHDDSYLLSIAGGTTTTLVLPDSAGAIGGQGYVIKLRDTVDRSPSSMLLEPYEVRSPSKTSSTWRHIKHTCGEHPSKVYNGTRMDTMWALRQAYARARTILQKQDDYCERATSGVWYGLGEFPEELRWEALVDVLRGRAKVHVNCHRAADLENIVQLSREFQFPIAVLHHASEAYLIPSELKRAFGAPPALALFAVNSRETAEAYRASEFAPRILSANGLSVLMKASPPTSDHPEGLNGRYLLYEAQQAFFYGLPANLALASVTSRPAEALGVGHRVGYIKRGWDADLVVWDSHPLALGATPSQVFIDGVPQFYRPYTKRKHDNFKKLPKTPNFDKEASDAILYDGLPPLLPKKVTKPLVLINVTSVYSASSSTIKQQILPNHSGPQVVVVAPDGDIVCHGSHDSCSTETLLNGATVIDLEGGSISPGLISVGSPLGSNTIDFETSTSDGMSIDPLLKPVPQVIGGDFTVPQAVDGLSFGTRDAILAYRAGVTSSITAPTHEEFYSGISAHFSTGALHKMEDGAVLKEIVAIHVSIGHSSRLSISAQMAALRSLLLGPARGAAGHWFHRITEGDLPLVIEAHSADVIASLIILKRETEAETKKSIKMTIMGGTEAYVLAQELAEENIGVILVSSRPFPLYWDNRRILPGPPLTNDTSITQLLSHGVTVGVGVGRKPFVRNLRFDLAWAALETEGRISKEEALAMGSVNIQHLLGVHSEVDLVITHGGDLLELGSRVIGVISPRRKMVHLTI
ncbi:hypothetical protein AMATHDRAFT_175162 [Amanita thiersii Skay4041]|uniref:Amidohydrolase-related domain-containing protein n=1 Tax=Amanita thiersii Skay4041 TaxID=703135 RepID=A0A2A9NQE9_9AGAR|nr:hypothetical protein AMATHDRAFT_175162 [Amanita thiersii Skay4041]